MKNQNNLKKEIERYSIMTKYFQENPDRVHSNIPQIDTMSRKMIKYCVVSTDEKIKSDFENISKTLISFILNDSANKELEECLKK